MSAEVVVITDIEWFTLLPYALRNNGFSGVLHQHVFRTLENPYWFFTERENPVMVF
jgi:hypothetical protein